MRRIVAGIVVVAALATLGDWVWATFEACEGMAAGVIHGAVLLTAVGGAIGAASGRLLRGLPIGALAGIGGALSYYALAVVLGGRVAIPAAWVVTWFLLAILEGRWVSPVRRSWLAIAVRGTAAAVLSGIAFWLVLDLVWGSTPEGGRNYAVQFAWWTAAWAPGLLALTLGTRRRA